MAVGKRGIIFTMMSILMVTIVLFAIRPQIISHSENRIPVIESRVDLANSHLYYLENTYIERVLRYCTFRAFSAYTSYLSRKQADGAVGYAPTTMAGLRSGMLQVLVNASVNGECLNCSHYGLYSIENNTLTDKLAEFSNLSREFLNINVSVKVNNITFFQSNTTGPWAVGITVNTSIELNTSLATWNVTEHNTTTIVSILSLEDWSYTHNSRLISGVSYPNYIYATNTSVWDRGQLINHILNHTYKHDPTAPSFLARFINVFNQSKCCGIESTIYPGWASYRDMSFIDYCYFGGVCNGSNPTGFFSLYNVTGITTSEYPFKIEPYHYAKERYNLTVRNSTYPNGILVRD